MGVSFAALSVRIISRALSFVPSLAAASTSNACTPELLQRVSGLHMERCATTLEAAVQLMAGAAATFNSSSINSTPEPLASFGEKQGALTGDPGALVSAHLERQLLSLSGEAASSAAAAAAALQQPACAPPEVRRCLALLHISLSGTSLDKEDWKQGLSRTQTYLLLAPLLLVLLGGFFLIRSLGLEAVHITHRFLVCCSCVCLSWFSFPQD